MSVTKQRLLLAIEDSEASFKAVRYVAALIGTKADVTIDLLHVLQPLPPAMLEFGGAEDPAEEAAQEAELHVQQEEWIRGQSHKAEPLFKKATLILKEAGLPAQSIRSSHCTCAHKQETVQGIIDAAKANGCGTIVVGRNAFHGLHKLFGHHISDQLTRRCRDLTIWVVE